MIDVYHATLDDLTRAALQSLFYFNYLRGGPSGTGPSKSELQLHLASRKGNSGRIVKLLEKGTAKAGVNTRVPHLEGETVFGMTKQKLDLSPGDESDSHCYNRVNYCIPMVGRGMSLAQTWNVLTASTIFGHSPGSVKSCTPQFISGKSRRTLTVQLARDHPQALTVSGLLVLESAYSDPTQWQIERISSDAIDVYCGCFEG